MCNHPKCFFFVVVICQVDVSEPMEDDTFTSYPIVIPTGSEEPLSCSPAGPSHLSNQLDSMNFERCGHSAEYSKINSDAGGSLRI